MTTLNKAPLVIVSLPSKQQMRISVQHDRVHLIVDGVLVADMPWEKAETIADVLRAKAAQAEANHWSVIEKFQGVPVKRVLGLPVVTSKEHYERIGDVK